MRFANSALTPLALWLVGFTASQAAASTQYVVSAFVSSLRHSFIFLTSDTNELFARHGGGGGGGGYTGGGYESGGGYTGGNNLSCKAGQYKSGSSCLDCPDDTFSGAGATKCTSCPEGHGCSKVRLFIFHIFLCRLFFFSFQQGSSQCTPKCPAGKVIKNGSCQNCAAGSFAPAGASSCSDCAEDTFSSAGASKCTACPQGHGCSKVPSFPLFPLPSRH